MTTTYPYKLEQSSTISISSANTLDSPLIVDTILSLGAGAFTSNGITVAAIIEIENLSTAVVMAGPGTTVANSSDPASYFVTILPKSKVNIAISAYDVGFKLAVLDAIYPTLSVNDKNSPREVSHLVRVKTLFLI